MQMWIDMAGRFAVIGSGGIEQQQGVPGRRRVHHDEFLTGLTDNA